MRHFAITGIVTASWISRIFSGSDIRATPPCTRMSAGTRSSAITATAPASSAIRAWSASTTSMITPPLSISARPVLTRIVPSSSIGESLLRRAALAADAADPAEELRERRALGLAEETEVHAVDAFEVGHGCFAKLPMPVVGELRVAHAPIAVAGRLRDEARALETGEEPRDPRRSQQHLRSEVDALEAAVRCARQAEQDLVVVDRQRMVALELGRELAHDRRVGAQQPRPRLEIAPGRRGGRHHSHSAPRTGARLGFGEVSAIVAEGLVREFKAVRAVDGIDLEVADGEIYGFLGPNGAGKTTTVRMLVTLLRPTGGRALVAGHDVATQPSEVRRRIGVALQEAALDPLMTGR